ncbi:MAG: fatty acid desaturase family protein [Oleiphilaceae bacterium]|nr:fatty acid desaturase family protein [Oleiphilaceae bacterium]
MSMNSNEQLGRRRVGDFFSREEIRALTARSDWMGAWAVASTWGIIALSFAAMAWATSQSWWIVVPVFLLAVAVIAGRQLCLAILMHDASHGTLFRTRWLNDVLSDWLCARPVWNDLHKYRIHHKAHHTRTSSDDDPDISLTDPFPTTRDSLVRKLARDLSGLTGLKLLFGRALQDAGLLKWTVANDVVWLPREGRRWYHHAGLLLRNMTPMLMMNALIFTVLALSGHGWLYLFWVLAYITPFPFFLRIRSLAEHACTERSSDMFRNTRTTRAGLLARAFVAPLRVHYHIEHHVMASVPWFRLKAMHQLLRERQVVGEPPGYLEVLRIVSSPEHS